MWVTNTKPHAQKITGPFTWTDFQSGFGEASLQRGSWLNGDSQPSRRERSGISCKVNPSRLTDVQAWKGTGGPAIIHLNATAPAPKGTTELQIDGDLSVVLDPAVPLDEAHWHAHWDKI